MRNNGDVLRFAGDAVLCAWCVSAGASRETLSVCTRAACNCALELLLKCGVYLIPELADTELSIHMGIGVSSMHAFRVGLPERWELLVYGSALQQAIRKPHLPCLTRAPRSYAEESTRIAAPPCHAYPQCT